jgi:DNA-binding CsgD family transcriptional regulator
MGQIVEAADDCAHSLALAEELGYPAGKTRALMHQALAAFHAGDLGSALQLARRVEQTSADIPGRITRLGSNTLTAVLAEAGDPAAAERSCTAGLARSRDAGDVQNQARLLTQKAMLDLRAGRFGDAAAQLREAIGIAVRAGGWTSVINGLDCCGYLCATTGRRAEAVTLWAAHASISEREGYTDPLPDTRRRREPLRGARQALGAARVRAAEERGAAMSLVTAAEYALLLATPGPQPPTSAPDAGRLSARERELIVLLAQGRTDAQIAAQLCISIRTVRTHLDRIRDKTGCRRRADLTRLALSEGLV